MSVERPILFQGDLVRAILADAKTVTRRPMKPQPDADGYMPVPGLGPTHHTMARALGRCPFGTAGDRLWVRETWAVPPGSESKDEAVYRADVRTEDLADERWAQRHGPREMRTPWTPSIHMPRWACRLLLDVTDVRAERLQSITDDDARDEGVRPDGRFIGGTAYRVTFAAKWDAIYGKDPALSWDANPWVWRVAFRRVPA